MQFGDDSLVLHKECEDVKITPVGKGPRLQFVEDGSLIPSAKGADQLELVAGGIKEMEMIVRFMTDIPLWQRIKILWYGRVFVQVDYRGQHEKMRIEVGAVAPGYAPVNETKVNK